MSVEKKEDIFSALAKKHDKIKDRVSGMGQQSPKEMMNNSGEAGICSQENDSVGDDFSSREVSIDAMKLCYNATISNLLEVLSKVCQDSARRRSMQKAPKQSLSILRNYHENFQQFFETMKSLLHVQEEIHKKLNSLQNKDWKPIIKKQQHFKSLADHKLMKGLRVVRMMNQMHEGTVSLEDVSSANSLLNSSEEISIADSD